MCGGQRTPTEVLLLGTKLPQVPGGYALERIRTADALLRTEALYPLSYEGRTGVVYEPTLRTVKRRVAAVLRDCTSGIGPIPER
jgi:hypothetical protein